MFCFPVNYCKNFSSELTSISWNNKLNELRLDRVEGTSRLAVPKKCFLAKIKWNNWKWNRQRTLKRHACKIAVLEIFNVAKRKENRFLSEDQISAVESQKYCSPHPFPGASDNNFRTATSEMLKNTISENLRTEQMQIEIDCQFIVDLSFMKFSATIFRLMCVSRTFFNRKKRLCCRRFNGGWDASEQEKKYLWKFL